jgi:putative transcriptional regulator
MAIVKFKLDPDNPPDLTDKERARLDALTESDIETNALSDPDNPALTDDELGRMTTARLVRRARLKTGLSQPKFASVYHFSVGRLRDLEQGRSRPDSAVLAYLTLIEKDPEKVREQLVTLDERP